MKSIDGINKSGSLGILCLQESWTDINEYISLFELPGYTLYHQGKQCCKHGGLLVYVLYCIVLYYEALY